MAQLQILNPFPARKLFIASGASISF